MAHAFAALIIELLDLPLFDSAALSGVPHNACHDAIALRTYVLERERSHLPRPFSGEPRRTAPLPSHLDEIGPALSAVGTTLHLSSNPEPPHLRKLAGRFAHGPKKRFNFALLPTGDNARCKVALGVLVGRFFRDQRNCHLLVHGDVVEGAEIILQVRHAISKPPSTMTYLAAIEQAPEKLAGIA